MDAALGWLGRLGDALLTALPRPLMVCTTHVAVVWLFGRWSRVLPPGYYVLWPLVEESELVPVTLQWAEMHRQTLTIEDRNVGVGGYASYTVTDPLFVAEHVEDLDETVRGVLAGQVAKVIADNPLAGNEELQERSAEAIEECGAQLESVVLSDRVALRHTAVLWNAE